MTIKEFFTTDITRNKYFIIVMLLIGVLFAWQNNFDGANPFTKEGRCTIKYQQAFGHDLKYEVAGMRDAYIDLCMNKSAEELKMMQDAFLK